MKLLDQPFRQAVGPGELDIPAVRGVGGSLIYFVDDKTELGRVWDVEFEPTRTTGHERAPGSPASTMSPSRCSTRRC